MTPRSPQANDPPAEPSEAERLHGEVLLVEDNDSVADVVQEMLQDFGYSVSTVSNAATALDAATKRKFDLIVSDILMPGSINGLELARRIRRQTPQQAILLVTGYSESAASAQSEFLVLRKPYRQADLRQAITAVFDAHRNTAPKPAPSNKPRL